MSSSTTLVASLSLLLLFPLIFHSASGAIANSCTDPENITSAYVFNVKKLFSFLKRKTAPTGFAFASIGEAPNQVEGLALCRGNVSVKDCNTCVSDTTSQLLSACPSNREGVMWSDNCLLKYSNNSFFGQIDTQNQVVLYNVDSASNPSVFNRKMNMLMSDLAAKAIRTPKFYAAGQQKLDKSDKLYGYVQCTKDLSSSVCKQCLHGLIGQLPSCCNAAVGARILTGSCIIRYEIYPFSTF